MSAYIVDVIVAAEGNMISFQYSDGTVQDIYAAEGFVAKSGGPLGHICGALAVCLKTAMCRIEDLEKQVYPDGRRPT